MSNVLPCIACGTVLEPAFVSERDDFSPPYGGTVFSSAGNYGSTVWDEMDNRRMLSITVCDSCLIDSADHGQVLLDTIVRYEKPVHEVVRWDPPAPEP